jgi:hypothetical protein
MSYDPSHRRPPRQERWPSATPAEGWPSYRGDEAYRGGDAYRGGEQAASGYEADRRGAYQTDYQRVAVGSGDYGYQAGGYQGGGYPGYGTANGGYQGTTDGFDGTADGYGWAEGGYGWAEDGYGQATGGYGGGYGGGYASQPEYARQPEYASQPEEYDWGPNGYGNAAHGYATGRDDYPPQVGYLGPGSYTEYSEPGSGDPRLMAPDAGVRPDTWQAEQDSRREARQRGMMVGGVTEVLGIAVAIGVSTLIAGLVKAQTSPVAAMGSVFIDRTPAALRTALLHHFGPHGRTVLLLGMYAAIAVVALVIGVLARGAAALGVAGIAAFTLFAAFVAVTRPAGGVGDVTPAVVGGIAGMVALLWLVRASAPMTPLRHTRGGARRRAQ